MLSPSAPRKFVDEGGTACATPAEAAASADIVVCVVVNAAQTEDVLFGDSGAAKADAQGQRLCDVLDGRSELVDSARAAASGARTSVPGRADLRWGGEGSGGHDDHDDGRRPDAYAKAGRVLDAVAANVYRLGDRAGNGSKVKIINQLLAGVHIAAAAEAMALGLREGVDAEGALRSHYAQRRQQLDVREPDGACSGG